MENLSYESIIEAKSALIDFDIINELDYDNFFFNYEKQNLIKIEVCLAIVNHVLHKGGMIIANFGENNYPQYTKASTNIFHILCPYGQSCALRSTFCRYSHWFCTNAQQIAVVAVKLAKVRNIREIFPHLLYSDIEVLLERFISTANFLIDRENEIRYGFPAVVDQIKF